THPPERCPSCGTPTEKPEGSVFTRCPNRVCPQRQWQLLKHFVSRGAMDFYRLTAEQLMELEGYGELSARRTVENIQRSKEQGLERLLFAIGLEEVGE